MKIGFIVLAGGRSFRFGCDKALETIGKQTLIDRVLEIISFFKSHIIVVTTENYQLPQFSYPNVKMVADIHTDKGPLGGIYSGLSSSDFFYNVTIACDMPFLNTDLLAYMTQCSTNFDLTIPRLGNMIEPLHAIYTHNCLTPIRTLLEHDELRVSSLLSQVKVRYVEASEINQFDPEHLSFFNVNTKVELNRARELIKQRVISHEIKRALV